MNPKPSSRKAGKKQRFEAASRQKDWLWFRKPFGRKATKQQSKQNEIFGGTASYPQRATSLSTSLFSFLLCRFAASRQKDFQQPCQQNWLRFGKSFGRKATKQQSKQKEIFGGTASYPQRARSLSTSLFSFLLCRFAASRQKDFPTTFDTLFHE
ncbi:MAG: hypothetical protein ACXIUB_00960 [Wenzhouxiangella sp.]